jgi:hypothetical protein
MVEVLAIGTLIVALIRAVFRGLAELRVAEGIKARLERADPMNPCDLLPRRRH